MTKVCLMCGGTFPDATTFCPKDGAALRAAVQGDDLIGEVFCDRYVVTDLLGEGGMGSVYVARDVRLPQQVAIKVLRERAMADPSTVARFRQEAEAASRINHDRIARVTDFGFMTDGRAYLVMEYVEGSTLKHVLSENGPLTLNETARIARMVAEGLDAAHRLSIVHRDLKPDNVMIVADEGGVRVKLLDFGIAKVMQTEESTNRTATGFVIGTPQWMSPEQILGSTIDARSDVYALGLLVHTMLTGRRAFDRGGSPEEEMMTRLSATANRLADVAAATPWPDGLQALLDRTLSRDVTARPASALAFAQELSDIANNAESKLANVSAERSQPARAQSPGSASEAAQIAALTSQASGNAATQKHVALDAAKTPANTTIGATTRKSTAGRNALVGGVSVAVLALSIFAWQQSRNSDGASPVTPVPSGTATPDSNSSASLAASTPVAASNDSATPGAGGGQPNQVPTQPASPQSPGKNAPPAGNSGAPVNAVTRGATNSREPGSNTNAAGATAAQSAAQQATAAHDELELIMDEADADIGAQGEAARTKAREAIRKLEQLLPKLSASKDRGNAHFYIGQSHATLGENDKACESLRRAAPLATQSPALNDGVEKLRDLLNCR